MLKKLLVVVVAMVLVFASYSYAGPTPKHQMEAEEKADKKLCQELDEVKQELKKLGKEYSQSQKELLSEQNLRIRDLAKTKGAAQARKSLITEFKKKQTDLRKDFIDDKKPLAEKRTKLANARRQCKRNMQKIKREVRKAQKEEAKNYDYINKLKDLRKQSRGIKNDFTSGQIKIQNNMKEDIVAMSPTVGKKKARKQALREAKKKEAALRQVYRKKKKPVDAQIKEAAAAYEQWKKEQKEAKRKAARL
ncbi:MAG: hypothetical protein HQ558_05465 [Candidatus Omnitrophica bacterium]|nr:hypothetical protein [Candidatus Omnitrophota bacterium]